jgi:prepilin-type N-terminal cleavage/methylation domain-containing protein
MSLAESKNINAVIAAAAVVRQAHHPERSRRRIQYFMQRRRNLRNDAGFTLLEIIVTILVASVLAALMVQFMNTAMVRGGDPAAAVRAEADTGAILEQIVSDYVQQINSDPEDALANIKSKYSGNSAVEMAYIRFYSSGQEENLGETQTDTLKVTVRKGGYSVTTLLTEARVKNDDPASKY